MIAETQLRVRRGKAKTLVGGAPGRKLHKGDELRVHDNKRFFSRLSTTSDSGAMVDVTRKTAWFLTADGVTEYIRYGTFRFKDLKQAVPDASSDEEEGAEEEVGQFYPFANEQLMVATDNPNLCEEMVRLWIAKKGRLEGYEDQIVGEIPYLTEASRFQQHAGEVGKLKAEGQEDFLGKLHLAYGTDVADHLKYLPIQGLVDTVDRIPSGGMMHVSLRGKDLFAGGHAVAFARMHTTLYYFDPAKGVFEFEASRLRAILAALVAPWSEENGHIPPGELSKYKMFYGVVVPKAGFQGLRRY